MRTALRHVLAGLVVIAAAACELPLGIGNGDENRLEENERRWAQRGYESYDLTVRQSCFCGFVEPVRVEVRNGVRTATVSADSGEPLPASVAEYFPTVPGLFEIVADAIARDAHHLDVRYDDVLGVPMRIEIDYAENVIDEEVTWTVIALDER